MIDQRTLVRGILRNVDIFVEFTSGLRLRSYQIAAAQAICDSVLQGKGQTFVVIFPRQSGKNELQAQIEAYLLYLLQGLNAEMVKVSPTWKPQSLNAMRRLERVLKRSPLLAESWSKESGYIFKVGGARITFLSGSPSANVVGATANTLLVCDEAQDVLISKWDKDINPMAASTNATRVFFGTAWTRRTLLAREQRLAQEAEQRDGIQRLFRITAEQVAAEVLAYGEFVRAEIEKFGREHPLVKTQYFSQEIDAESGMFPAARCALMRGGHLPLMSPSPAEVARGEIYAFLLDIAGEDESIISESTILQDAALKNSGRDSTALTIVRLDLSLLDTLRYPRYQVVQRRLWVGVKHTALFGQVLALVDSWEPRYIVCDSTGVGAGLASFLTKALGKARLIPFVFSAQSKSKLGWDFLGVIETGRFADHAARPAEPEGAAPSEQQQFWREVEATQFEILPGPGRLMRWGVPDGTRDPTSGAEIHDDLVISAALCAVLDTQSWGLAESAIVPAPDPLDAPGDVY